MSAQGTRVQGKQALEGETFDWNQRGVLRMTKRKGVSAPGGFTVVTPTGCIGNRGIHRETLVHVLDSVDVQAIASDAGSFDCGPWYLGMGQPHSPTRTIEWDLDLLLTQARARDIPLIIGTAGGSGGRPHLDFTVDLVKKIAARRGLHFQLATISADVDREYLSSRAARELIPPIDHEQPLTPGHVDEAVSIVAMMGAEPMIQALEEGADVVVAGRASDSAVIAAAPMRQGADPGLAHHMGDVMECGESIAVELEPLLRALGPNRIPIVGTVLDESFRVRPGHPSMACTPQSVAAHAMYERASIFGHMVPGGLVDRSRSTYHQVDRHTTEVSGTVFRQREPYTVLLEGVRRVGFRSILIAGARTPRLVRQIDQVVEAVCSASLSLFSQWGKAEIYPHIYGAHGVLGDLEPTPTPSHEVGIVFDVIAEDQKLAHDVAEDLLLRLSFWRYQGRQTTAGNIAVLFSPNVIDGGEAFETHIFHALPVKDPLALFPIKLEQV